MHYDADACKVIYFTYEYFKLEKCAKYYQHLNKVHHPLQSRGSVAAEVVVHCSARL